MMTATASVAAGLAAGLSMVCVLRSKTFWLWVPISIAGAVTGTLAFILSLVVPGWSMSWVSIIAVGLEVLAVGVYIAIIYNSPSQSMAVDNLLKLIGEGVSACLLSLLLLLSGGVLGLGVSLILFPIPVLLFLVGVGVAVVAGYYIVEL